MTTASRSICDQGGQGGANVLFEGEKGTISVSRGKIESNPPEILKEPLGPSDVHLYVSKSHHGNWLDCIKSRKLPICDVAIGHRSATVCHLGNIAVRTRPEDDLGPRRRGDRRRPRGRPDARPPLPGPLAPPGIDRHGSACPPEPDRRGSKTPRSTGRVGNRSRPPGELGVPGRWNHPPSNAITCRASGASRGYSNRSWSGGPGS